MAFSLFDAFSTQPAEDAAAAQTTGLTNAYQQLSDLFGQGTSALTTGTNSALAALRSRYGQAAAPQQTVFDTGTQGLTAYGNAAGLNGPGGTDAALAAFFASPAYQAQLKAGNNSILAQEAATGQTGSGNELKALSDYNQQLAGTGWNNYVSSLSPYFGQQQTGAAGLSGVFSGLGQGTAGLYSGLGTGINTNLLTQGNAAYGTQAGIGNAQAGADLSAYNASGNLLGALLGLGKLGTGTANSTIGGSLLSGAGSGLLGMLSDERAKEDIRPIGKLYDGLKVYSYRYKGDPRHQIGLMAQEVERVRPDAVHELPWHGGLKSVDYQRATDLAAELGRFVERRAA